MKLTNNVARFGWWFSACFLLMCAAFTYILVRDGSSNIQVYPPSIPDYYPPWVLPIVLAVFWGVGLGVAKYLVGIPCVAVEVDANGAIRIHRRYPFRTESQTVESKDIAAVEVVETKDSEGDPYFEVRLTTVDNLTVEIAESSDRAVCESALARLKQCLAGSAAT